MNWSIPLIPIPSESFYQDAVERQAQLTKPPGSLGLLETLAVRLASLQSNRSPCLENVWISIFAADHGVAEENVSAFPQSVTREMLGNFTRGGAAISLLAKMIDARLEIIDAGVVGDETEVSPGLIIDKVGSGTHNFTQKPAMTPEQLKAALEVGSRAANRARKNQANLFIGGEMGIANTTSASALAIALLQVDTHRLTGPGTGLNAQGVLHKQKVIETALKLHQAKMNSPLEIMRHLGGFEIAALTGAYLQAASFSIPSLVDGFIASVAALFACKIQPACSDWLFFAHRSAEPGHDLILNEMNAKPLLDLSMRLGEGSGAALAVSLMRAACALHNGMATFAEAGIQGKS